MTSLAGATLTWNAPPGPESASDQDVQRLLAGYFEARARLLDAEGALLAAGLEVEDPAALDDRTAPQLRRLAAQARVGAEVNA